MKIDPKCLKFHESANKGAAYTSDGFMLPCCWMDDPPVHRYIVDSGLKDPELAVANNNSLEEIFTSDQWENFFYTILYNPKNASYMCKKKCGVGFDSETLKEEEIIEIEKIRKNNG